MKINTVIILTLLCIPHYVGAVSHLSLTSASLDGWNVLLDESSLIDGAGSDYVAQMTSRVMQDVLAVESDTSWDLYIQSDSIVWNEAISLTARVSEVSKNPPLKFVQKSFVEITSRRIKIASGTGSISSIGIQYLIDGISISKVDQNHLEKSIIFSLEEL